MGLNVGNVPVKQVYVGSTPAAAVYVGSEKIWPTRETVQITLDTGNQARDQFRAALTARGLNYQTVTEIPFDIELVGSGSAQNMFYGCSALTSAPAMGTSNVTNMWNMFRSCAALTSVPAMDTSNVTDMRSMFNGCSSLTHVPDMDTSQVADMGFMFYYCSSLTDGNVRLIGRHPQVDTTDMILGSGLTREPFYTTDGQPWPTAEVHQVSLTNKSGDGTAHPLVTVTVPAGETWSVRVQGTMQSTFPDHPLIDPQIRIGSSTSSGYGNNATVDYSGTITSANSTIALVTREVSYLGNAGFTGTVTIEK